MDMPWVVLAEGLILMVILWGFLIPVTVGLNFSLINRKLEFILYMTRTLTAKHLEPGSNAFCQCVGMLAKCDFFLMHETEHVGCGMFQRYCCRKEALEQMLHKLVSGREYVPPKTMTFKPYKDYVHIPQIRTQAAKTARSKCGCSLPFWGCPVAITKPWAIFDQSFKCSLIRVFCCDESFLKDLVVPTVKLHAATTKEKS